MLAFILVILFIWGGHDALQHYKAEKYANKVVYNKDTSFFDFMFSNHPIITITSLVLIILIVIYAIISCFPGHKEQKYYNTSYSYVNETCNYHGCGDRRTEGSLYCYKHTCSVDGCYNQANGNTMFKYCDRHQRELTCAVDGCCADRYRDSIYCNMHYPDGK